MNQKTRRIHTVPSENNHRHKNQYAAWLIAAAFIGPGTVTTASIAGAQFGYHVIWALLFSVFATWVLQDMAVRLGVVTKQGLAEAIRTAFQSPILKALAIGLVIGAIGVGNAAYEGGNITGAALGLSQLTQAPMQLWVVILAVLAFGLLWFGKQALVEKVLVGLVGLMSVIFIITVLTAEPDWGAFMSAAIAPRFDSTTFTVVLALIGTTIVPYNLFLHASLVSKSGGELSTTLAAQRKTNTIAIVTGGIITLAILTTATAAFYQTGKPLDASNIAQQLTPLLGENASKFFAVGLFAAGLTSAITAPLAASYAVCGALQYSTDPKSKAFRLVWITVLVIGAIVASIGFKPLAAMLFAQATNGLLLPFIAIFLLVAMNNQERLGHYRNSVSMNAIGLAIVIIVSLLGLRKLVGVF